MKSWQFLFFQVTEAQVWAFPSGEGRRKKALPGDLSRQRESTGHSNVTSMASIGSVMLLRAGIAISRIEARLT
jgi:hypothetical protein